MQWYCVGHNSGLKLWQNWWFNIRMNSKYAQPNRLSFNDILCHFQDNLMSSTFITIKCYIMSSSINYFQFKTDFLYHWQGYTNNIEKCLVKSCIFVFVSILNWSAQVQLSATYPKYRPFLPLGILLGKEYPFDQLNLSQASIYNHVYLV